MTDWSIFLAMWPALLGAFVFGYVLGSIPFGLVLTRIFGGPDIRSIGSGNIGATNVLRTGRKGLAAATLLLDMLKGTVAVLIAHHLLGEPAAIAAGLGAFLGHLFPVWLGFKGGKGVATFIGVLLGFSWQAVLIYAGIWVAIAFITRYSSLSGLIACAATPAILWTLELPTPAKLFFVLAVLVFVMHRANIARLISGTENKIGQSTVKS
ncbi:glycerol-3-phosphate 1-O-acyltransferase PlsY [Pseudorhodoplanes sinuspersici]|uniref:Glycerol-3-phosphate acyltransferase n=1 Tax=Pseudorhodoplanes sinuspersici TaxID=1235591 RepID=A0A1W6ZVN0_9HYPH|nr:glycerol-3-phosphate 1-O-acyltransferase PlsY [Pseudorhodoplanes sinuspersici]ARQ01489.1 glycerol-3-phosphate acyltransferase [Pseudorhodoplanes sinuspersici]RKE73185.1 acyl-phosphate glycerol-3-phosphate acyltransferase [Pseudorhodoplanes sinuspersici]